MVRHVSATEARVHIGELLRAVSAEGAQVVVERGSKPAAVVISKEEFDRFTNKPTRDWWEIVLETQRVFADARQRGALPDMGELIRDERDKRDAQLLDNMLRRQRHRALALGHARFRVSRPLGTSSELADVDRRPVTAQV